MKVADCTCGDDSDIQEVRIDDTLYLSGEPCDECVRSIFTTTTVKTIRWQGGAVVQP